MIKNNKALVVRRVFFLTRRLILFDANILDSFPEPMPFYSKRITRINFNNSLILINWYNQNSTLNQLVQKI
ncbi:hypothetical protein BpHYR1_034750 [Brachionus plicatilis]|uniref:Uncharacterized protein n=1 Tax=Brachionus plicatilis TaxID=10195 RepID=A0A3M7RST5_BRAPC|nr:hypothetical protein BpHYR1_034750 [Brachionus plicatilis]